jgi:hypothetical protein
MGASRATSWSLKADDEGSSQGKNWMELHSHVYLISYIWLATMETKWDSKINKYDDLATPSAIRTAEHRRGTCLEQHRKDNGYGGA